MISPKFTEKIPKDLNFTQVIQTFSELINYERHPFDLKNGLTG